MATMQDNVQSKRVRQFLKVVDKALQEAKKSIDAESSVEECYGDDAAIFAGMGGDDNDTISLNKKTEKMRSKYEEEKEGKKMLANLIEGMMDRVNETVKIEVQALIERESLNSKFAKLERISDILQKEDNEKKMKEANDRQKTKEALHQLLKLPEGCSPVNLINFHAYRVKLEQKEALLAEINSIDAETEAIQAQINRGKETIHNGMQDIEQMGEVMSNAADICSLTVE